MNKWISRFIIAVLLIGAFAGVGVTAYRIGYQQGAQTSGVEAPQFFHRFDRDNMPQFHPGWNGHGFDRGPQQGFGNNRFPAMDRGRGFGFFSPFEFLFKLILLGLVIWFGYTLFKGKGWTLSLTRQPVNNEAETATPKKKTAKPKE